MNLAQKIMKAFTRSRRHGDDPVESLACLATRRQWVASAAGAAIGGTALVAEAAVRPRAALAQNANYVDLTSNQTVGGIKTFSQAPVLPTDALPQTAVVSLVSDLAAKQAVIPPGTYTRVPSSGALAARPLATLIGQTYLASDVAGGTPFASLDGSTWTQVAAGVNAAGGVSSVDAMTGVVSLAGRYVAYVTGLDPTGGDDATFLIQAAIDAAAAAGGGTVMLPVGTFKITADVNLASNVTIQGCGRHATLISSAIGLGLRLTSVSLASARHLGLTSVSTPSTNGIGILGSTDCTIEDVWMNGGHGWGIFVGANGAVPSQRIIMNRIHVAGTSSTHDIEINDSHYCVISNCHLVGSPNTNGNNVEIYESTAANKPTGNQILNNHMEASPNGGVVDWGAVGTVIDGNTILNAGSYGIISATGEQPGGTAAREGCIVNNRIIGANAGADQAYGIAVGGDDYLVEGNVVTGTLAGPGGSGGIFVGGNRPRVIGNVCRLNAGPGMLIQSALRATIALNDCSDNSVTIANSDGIQVSSCDKSVVFGNHCTDTRATKKQRYGILISPGPNVNNRVFANVCDGNLSGEVFDRGTGTLSHGNSTTGPGKSPGGMIVGPDANLDASGLFQVSGGRTYLKGGGGTGVLVVGLGYDAASTGKFWLGTNHQTIPDLTFANAAGTVVARLTNAGVLVAGSAVAGGNAGAGDIESTVNGRGLILRAPNGTRYRISVTNAGTLSVAAP